nr:hypothetical protein [Mycoplasmopsis bovis]
MLHFKGTNENWNGMIEDVSKGFDFNSILSSTGYVVNQINEMPRKILNWQKPLNYLSC